MFNFKFLKSRKNSKKKIILATCSLFLLFFTILLAILLSLKANTAIDVVSIQQSEVVEDPTKLNLPEWVNILIQVSIWLVVALLAIGIICFSIYIITYFWKRKYSKTYAYISEKEDDADQTSPNLVRITLGEEVANEKSN